MSRRTRRIRALVVLCSGLLPGRAAAESLPDARSGALPRGVVVERVTCAGAPDQSYALYLPSGYTPDRSWPILYAFDPAAQGARPVRLAAEPAERFGWIVAGSNNSRNGPNAEIQAAVKALIEDTGARFPIDARRVYATGFSGGARVAAGVALGCRGCVAGVFAQGAGLPAGASTAGVLGFAWFAAAGERDFNYAELFLLEQELGKRGARQRLRVFAGAHEWAPTAVWSEAIEWFELLAMTDGLRPRDSALASSLFERASARAADFQARGELLDEQREQSALARDFDGFTDVAAARRRSSELLASSAYRKALERERATIDEQARVTSELHRDLALLSQADSDQHVEAVLRATRDASELRSDLTHAKQPDRRLVYERALAEVFVEAMESGRNALRQQQTEPALQLYQIASLLRPEAPAPHLARAQVQARAGRTQDATRSLRRALELGLAPAELARQLETNDAFARLREDPDVLALVKAARQP